MNLIRGIVGQGAVAAPATDAHDDFESYATGSLPSAWTERWNQGSDFAEVIGSSGQDGSSQAFSMDCSEAIYHLWSMDAADSLSNVGDVEILALVGIPASGGNNGADLIARASGAVGSQDCYFVHIESGTKMRMARLLNGGFSSTTATYNYSDGTWHWIRFRCNGNTQKAKAWAFGDSEPGSWLIEQTWTDHSTGWVGLGAYQATPPFNVDEIHVASDGGTAATT